MSRVEEARADCEWSEFECSELLRRIAARGHLTPALLTEARSAVARLRSHEAALYRAMHTARRTGTKR